MAQPEHAVRFRGQGLVPAADKLAEPKACLDRIRVLGRTLPARVGQRRSNPPVFLGKDEILSD